MSFVNNRKFSSLASYYCSVFLIVVSHLIPGARFYKRTNSKEKTRRIDNFRCAADCLKDPTCKGSSVQRDVYPQCVRHGEEIFNISESISIDLWVKGKSVNCLPSQKKNL